MLFARNQWQARHPELWEGLYSAWCPGLGPTGVTLFDLNATRHGSFTRLGASAWTIENGQYCVRFDGDDEYINLGMASFAANDGTMMIWAKSAISSSGNYKTAFGRNRAGANDGDIAIQYNQPANKMGFYVQNASGVTALLNAVTGIPTTWTHYAGTWSASGTNRFYVNGIEQESGTGRGTLASSDTFAFGAERGYDPVTTANTWDGWCDDAALYTRQLSAGEIRLAAMGRGVIFLPRSVFAFFPAAITGNPHYYYRNQMAVIG